MVPRDNRLFNLWTKFEDNFDGDIRQAIEDAGGSATFLKKVHAILHLTRVQLTCCLQVGSGRRTAPNTYMYGTKDFILHAYRFEEVPLDKANRGMCHTECHYMLASPLYDLNDPE
jgi:hypothetical protein